MVAGDLFGFFEEEEKGLQVGQLPELADVRGAEGALQDRVDLLEKAEIALYTLVDGQFALGELAGEDLCEGVGAGVDDVDLAVCSDDALDDGAHGVVLEYELYGPETLPEAHPLLHLLQTQIDIFLPLLPTILGREQLHKLPHPHPHHLPRQLPIILHPRPQHLQPIHPILLTRRNLPLRVEFISSVKV